MSGKGKAVTMSEDQTPESAGLALSEALEELERLEEKWGKGHPELVNTLSRAGGICWDLKRYQKSVAYGERALDILEKELGPVDSQTVTSAENLIAALIRMKRFQKALSVRNRLFKRMEADHPRYPYFQALKAYIAKESTKSGFRPPAKRKKKKKKRRR